MNDDFESRLMRDVAATPRSDPTREWKDKILAAAASASTQMIVRVPRWLLVSWASCWVATLILHFMTPSSRPDVSTAQTTTVQVTNIEKPSLAQHSRTLEAMLAQN